MIKRVAGVVLPQMTQEGIPPVDGFPSFNVVLSMRKLLFLLQYITFR